MKKRIHSQSAFLYVRLSIGLVLVLTGVFLALMSVGQFSAHAQQRTKPISNLSPALIPPLLDCSQIKALGLDKQENLRAGAINIFCGTAQGGSALDEEGMPLSIAQQILAPLLGTSDVDLITGSDTGSHITQSETFTNANPDNPNEIVVAYNDSRGVASNPINISGASVSEDGGVTFTRLTRASTGQSPFANTFGDPVILYNKPTATWFAVWLDAACGGQGLGGYKSTTPSDPDSWTHFCAHSGFADDRESGWADNNPSSPFFGHMYVSYNDFNIGGGALFVRFSSDNGVTWNARQLSSGFFRDVQITGDAATGTVYVASMNEMGGGLTNRANLLFKSTDGGATFQQVYTGPTFAAPGRTSCPNTYFACMFNDGRTGYWRHMGWGQPAALNNVVHYVYDSRNTSNGDPANVFYIRSTDGGVTFGAPVQLNTDSTTKGQWQPNISIGDDNSLLAVWYDEREATAACVKGNTSIPCYRMWGRKSIDGGVTWMPDEAFSDVVTPLPNQADPFIVTEYVGDYDYSSASPNQHLHPWADGRVAIGSSSQQDAFFDREPAGGGGGELTLSVDKKGKTRDGMNRVLLAYTGASSSQVDVFRNDVLIATTANTGSYADTTADTGRAKYTYRVCEAGTSTCSNDVTVKFSR